MGWHQAYLVQARSDYAVLKRLGAAGVENCHRLHYLQMVTEKISKAMLTPPNSKVPAQPSHRMFVRMLQVIKSRPEIRQQLGFRSSLVFKSYLDSILDLAAKIEELSPDQAGFTQPNPEYPWQEDASQPVVAPAEHCFAQFDPRDPRMVKIERLIDDLLRLTN